MIEDIDQAFEEATEYNHAYGAFSKLTIKINPDRIGNYNRNCQKAPNNKVTVEELNSLMDINNYINNKKAFQASLERVINRIDFIISNMDLKSLNYITILLTQLEGLQTNLYGSPETLRISTLNGMSQHRNYPLEP